MIRARWLPVGLALLFLHAGAGSPAAAEDPDPSRRALLEVEASRREVYVGEPFTVLLRLALDREWFREHAVPLFRRVLEVPVKVEASWLASVPGAERLVGPPPPPAPRRSLAAGDAVVQAAVGPARILDGRTFEILELQCRYLPRDAGEIRLEAPRLHFAWAPRFQEDLLGGRTPVDRREARAEGPSLSIRVRDLPAEGRPADFTGLVGRITAKAESTAREAEVGEAVALRLSLAAEGPGESNLAVVDLPPLQVPGFHVLGVRETSGGGTRAFHADLAPLAATTREIPSLAFSYFDPGPPAGYRIARTDGIPLRVGPKGPRAAPLPSEVAPGAAPVWPWLLGSLAGAGLLVWLLRRRRGRGRGDAPDPRLVAFERARGAFLAVAGGSASDLAGPFADVLAVRLGCSPAAVISPDLAARLVTSGVPPAEATRAARTLERLVAARYGGTTTASDARAARDLLDALAPHPAP